MSIQFYSPSEWIDHLTTEISAADYSKVKDKDKIVKHMLALIERLPTPTARKKLDEIQVAVMTVFEKAAYDSSSSGKKIRNLANEILDKVEVFSKPTQQVRKAAAHRGQASMAAGKLKSMQAELTTFRKSPEGILIDTERQALIQQLADVHIQLAAATEDVEKKKAAEALAKQQNQPAAELANLHQIGITAERSEIAIKEQIETVKQKIADLGNKIVLQQAVSVSRNPVLVQKMQGFVLKLQSHELESRVRLVLEELEVEDAVAPVAKTKSHGAIEYIEEGTTQRKPEASGIVQPLIEHAIPANELLKNQALYAGVKKLLDPADTQKKMGAQGDIAAWDLHANNAFVKLIPNDDYEEATKYKWDYRDAQTQTWKQVDFFQLTRLKLSGAITDQTLVRRADKPQNERLIVDSRQLQNAFASPWQFVMFDNEAAMGGKKEHNKGNPNHYNLWGGRACVPIRCFFLGTELATQPLGPKEQERLLKQSQRIDRLKKVLGEGNPLFLRRLSKATQAELKAFFQSKSFFFTVNVASGNGKEDLFAMMPPALLQKVTADLIRNGVISPPKPVFTTGNQDTHATQVQDLKKKLSDFHILILQKGLTTNAEFNKMMKDLDNSLDPLFPQKICDPKAVVSSYLDVAYKRLVDLIKKQNLSITHAERTTLDSLKESLLSGLQEISTRNQQIGYPAYKAKLYALYDKHLFPPVDPGEVTALTERMEKSGTYVTECQSKIQSLRAIQESLPPPTLNAWTKQKTDETILALVHSMSLVKSLAHMPFEQYTAYEQEATLLTSELQSATQSGVMTQDKYDKVLKLFAKTAELLQPTTYGRFNKMFPHYFFYIDLLVKIEAKERNIQQPKPEQYAAIRREFLVDEIAITLPSQKYTSNWLVTTPCKKILAEAVHCGVVTTNDPRYQAALQDLNKALPK